MASANCEDNFGSEGDDYWTSRSGGLRRPRPSAHSEYNAPTGLSGLSNEGNDDLTCTAAQGAAARAWPRPRANGETLLAARATTT